MATIDGEKIDAARNACSTAGTGTLTLGDNITGAQSIKARMTTGKKSKFYFRKGAQWISFEGTFTSPDQLARTRIIDGSGGLATNVDFAVGAGEVANDVPAEELDALNLIETTLTSAATFDIGAVYARFINSSGTTGPVTSLGTSANKERIVKWSGQTVNHHGTSLKLIGAANYVTASGDYSLMKSDASGNWQEIWRHPANGSPALSATSFRAAIFAAPLEALAFNNAVINAATEVSQESGTTGVVLTAGGTLLTKYIVDMVVATYKGTFVVTGQQVTDAPPGFKNSVKFTVGTAQSSLGSTDELTVRIPIEGLRLGGKFSFGNANAASYSRGFWIRGNRTGPYSGTVRNVAGTRSNPFSFTINVANTWEFKTVYSVGDTSGTWPTDNGVGIYLVICLAAGSGRVSSAGWQGNDVPGITGTTNGVAATTDTFQVTGEVFLPNVDLTTFNQTLLAERSRFIMRPFDQEIPFCQRCYEKSYDYAVAPGAVNSLLGLCVGVVPSNTIINFQGYGTVPVKPKRTVGTVLVYGYGGTATAVSNGNPTDLAANSGQAVLISESGFNPRNTTGGDVTTTTFSVYFHWVYDARLP